MAVQKRAIQVLLMKHETTHVLGWDGANSINLIQWAGEEFPNRNLLP
jgi:hypothetical protein